MPESHCLNIETNLSVPMRDGTILYADVFRPEAPGPFPVLLQRTPYDKSAPLSMNMLDPLKAAKRGYAVVIQDVRGRFESEGQFEPFINEERDGWATIEWITSQQWCNGVVAGAGASYNAYCQQVVACAAHPALAAWVPALAPADVRDTWIRLGGAFNYGFHLSWALGSLTIPASPAWADPETTTR